MKNIYEKQVYKILKKFVEDEVHGADFDQDLKHTLNVLKRWWNANKHKFEEKPKPKKPSIHGPDYLYNDKDYEQHGN